MPSIQSISAALRLPSLLTGVLRRIDLQKKYIKDNVTPVLNNALSVNDAGIDEGDVKKISGYYALAVPAILGEGYCALRGFPMTAKERWASTCQGAMSALFDDFFDKDDLDEGSIEKKILCEPATTQKTASEELFDTFYSGVLQSVADPLSLKKALMKVYHAQVESKEQTTPISKERIHYITLNKGGVSAQFYRSAFDHPLKPGEEEVLYLQGGLLQLANDIFDVYKDRQAKINTIVTTTDHIRDVRDLFNGHLTAFYNKAWQLPYPRRNIRHFLDLLSIGVFSRCQVCLDHLEKSEATSGSKFMLNQYSREQLVCDMDSGWNLLRSAAYQVKCKM